MITVTVQTNLHNWEKQFENNQEKRCIRYIKELHSDHIKMKLDEIRVNPSQMKKDEMPDAYFELTPLFMKINILKDETTKKVAKRTKGKQTTS